MSWSEVARKYSQALYQLGKEQQQLSLFQEELEAIRQIFNENEELKKVFYHQRVQSTDKKEIINKIFAEQLSAFILNFLCLLIDQKREDSLVAIIREFNYLVNKEQGIIEVEVVSAIELDRQIMTKLTEKLKQAIDCQIILKEKCDPSIIGGLILKIGDYIIDGSIKNHLSSLEERIEQIPVSRLGV